MPLTREDMRIINFYDPVVRGSYHPRYPRTLEKFLQWDYVDIEHSHDFIQVLFPVPEPSGVQNRQTVSTEGVRNAFRNDPQLRYSLFLAFLKM